jgi:hypothetical protein
MMATSSTDVHIGPSGTAPESPSAHLTPDDRVGLLRAMLLMRAIEERAMNLYRQGKVPGSFYDGFGQEAVSVGATWAMAGPDRLCVLHRDLGAHLVRGVQPANILAQYMGREAGITSGRDGNVHFGDPRTGCVGMVSMLPDMMLVAAGMAMAFKLRREARCALTWFGDGSTSRGDFHEAMNWAGVQHLPVIFILENNQFAYSTPIKQQFAVNPVERAAGYGFPGVSVDGNDAEAVFEGRADVDAHHECDHAEGGGLPAHLAQGPVERRVGRAREQLAQVLGDAGLEVAALEHPPGDEQRDQGKREHRQQQVVGHHAGQAGEVVVVGLPVEVLDGSPDRPVALAGRCRHTGYGRGRRRSTWRVTPLATRRPVPTPLAATRRASPTGSSGPSASLLGVARGWAGRVPSLRLSLRRPGRERGRLPSIPGSSGLIRGGV